MATERTGEMVEVPVSFINDIEARLTKLEEENAELREENAELRKRVTHLEEENAELKKENVKLKERVSGLETAVKALSLAVETLNGRVTNQRWTNDLVMKQSFEYREQLQRLQREYVRIYNHIKSQRLVLDSFGPVRSLNDLGIRVVYFETNVHEK